MAETETNHNEFYIEKARISFPFFFGTRHNNEGKEMSKGCKFLLDPEIHADLIKQIRRRIQYLIKTELKVKKLGSDRVCLRDGDDTGREEHENYMVLSANVSGNGAFYVYDKNKKKLTSEDKSNDPFYGGCYANGFVSLWVQNNPKHGKRINCSLEGVQFAADGESFGNRKSEDEVASRFQSMDDMSEDD